MQRLNIPLKRHQKTTRRPRWVVWMSVGFLSFGLYLVYFLCVFWFTRPVLAKAAPADTSFAVRFNYTNSTKDSISDLIAHIPLVSNRSLTVKDLEPVLSGDFMVFIGNDLSRSVAFRTKDAEALKTQFDAQKIVMTKIDSSTLLLSEKLIAVKGIETPSFFKRNTFVFSKNWIGDVFLPESKMRAPIYANDSRYEIDFPFSKKTQQLTGIPQNTLSFLSLPPTVPIETQAISRLFSPISSMLNDSFETFLSSLTTNQGFLVVTVDDRGIGFLIVSDKRLFDETEFEMQTLLKTIASLNSPKTLIKSLPDGTTTRELVADPDLISVEQRSVLSKKVFRAQTNNSNEILGTEQGDQFAITNREELIRFYFNQNEAESLTTHCGSNTLGMNLKQFSSMTSENAQSFSRSLVHPFSGVISEVGLVNKKYSTKLFMCR